MSIVFALATPTAKSAICVFRVSGKGCLDAVEKIFNKAAWISIPSQLMKIQIMGGKFT